MVSQYGAEVKKHQAAIETLEKKKQKTIDANMEAKALEFAGPAITFLATLGIAAKHNLYSTNFDSKRNVTTGQVRVQGQKFAKVPNPNNNNQTYEATVATGNIDQMITVEASEELHAVLADIEAAQNDLTEAQKNFGDWRVKLAEMPSHERTIKANLAQRKLQESAEGQAILAELALTFERDLLGLPNESDAIEVKAKK